MRFLKKTIIFCFAVVLIYTITVLVLMATCEIAEPATLTENVFRYFSVEAVMCGVIKAVDVAKDYLDAKNNECSKSNGSVGKEKRKKKNSSDTEAPDAGGDK